MGWLSIQRQIEYNKLVFLWHLVCLPTSSIYKRLLIKRYCYITFGGCNKSEGPLSNMLGIAIKYGIHETVVKAIETGYHMSLPIWKRHVKHLIMGREEREWAIKSPLFSSMDRLVSTMPNLEVSAWWIFVQKNPSYVNRCKIVMKLLLGVHQLNTCRYKYDRDVNPLCSYCETFKYETVEHMLFECHKWTDMRRTLWQEVLDACPSIHIQEHIVSTPLHEKVNGYVKEWNSLYCALVNFVAGMYNMRNMVT